MGGVKGHDDVIVRHIAVDDGGLATSSNRPSQYHHDRTHVVDAVAESDIDFPTIASAE